MYHMTIAELSAGLREKSFSSVELTQCYLDRIASLDSKLNSYITACSDDALAQAREADKRIAEGTATALTGIPIAYKDIFCTNGVKTSCGSKMLDNFIAPYTATCVDKLAQTGMVMLGKTNMDEFAMGSSNENSFYGPVRNPWNTETVPGGSSGGSAAAVAARLTPVALGTDTGGSIRQPAAFCGITGLKPTYGRVSRWGMIAFASSLDQAGPMTVSAEDAAMVLAAMAGWDQRDSTSVEREVEDYRGQIDAPLTGLKLGLPKEYFDSSLNPDIAAAVQAAVKLYEEMGAQVVEVSLPRTHLSVPAYYVVAPAEASSNLSRYDGVRFGHRCEDPQDLKDLYERSRAEGFGDEVKRRIMIGTYALSAGYYDAYYLKAQKIRRLISDDFQRAFEQVDLVIGPTTPTQAFPLADKSEDPLTMYLSDIYTVSANLAGLPAVSLPAGFANGLPIGLQLIGNYFQESRLLNAAHQYQCQTNWHRRLPDGFN